MAKQTRMAKIKEDIAKLEADLEAARDKEASRIGALAVRAGLSEIDISDKELLAALSKLAETFRKSAA